MSVPTWIHVNIDSVQQRLRIVTNPINGKVTLRHVGDELFYLVDAVWCTKLDLACIKTGDLFTANYWGTKEHLFFDEPIQEDLYQLTPSETSTDLRTAIHQIKERLTHATCYHFDGETGAKCNTLVHYSTGCCDTHGQVYTDGLKFNPFNPETDDLFDEPDYSLDPVDLCDDLDDQQLLQGATMTGLPDHQTDSSYFHEWCIPLYTSESQATAKAA